MKIIEKEIVPEDEKYEIPLECRSINKVKLQPSKHFDASVTLDKTSVHVATEVFDCGKAIL